MKKQEINIKKSLIKKIFIKICRILDFEIIDQNNFFVPTLNKNLNENLNIPGKKSITIPLGEVKVTRKVKALNIIFRSCTNVNMLTQNKKRLFNKDKSEYTFRSLNSILQSLAKAKKIFSDTIFEITVIDFNSKKEDLDQIKKQLLKSNLKNTLISLDINEYKNNINKVNAKNQQVSDNQMSNMSNIHKSLLVAKNEFKDLVYFVEDDYIHQREAIQEMLFTYERLSSQFNNELFLCPADYPYLYTKTNPTNIFIGSKKPIRHHASKTEFKVEPTRDTYQMSIPNWNPFKAISFLASNPFFKKQ